MMNLKFTAAELLALISILDELESSIGCAENDDMRIKWLKKLDQMLSTNGVDRKKC